MAYSRNPYDLFESIDGNVFHPPMNINGLLHNGRQPVRYTNVRMRLSSSDGLLRSGDELNFVNVNWNTGEISVFANSEDCSCGVACFQTTIRPASAVWDARTYAYEAEMFVRRGHSLTDPNCQCKHNISGVRADQLGITSSNLRSGRCTLKRSKIHTIDHLAFELALHSPLSFVDAHDESLSSLLRPFISRNDDFVREIRICNKDVLIHEVRRVWPRPISLPPISESYFGIARDIEDLQKQNIIRVLRRAGVDEEDMIFYAANEHNRLWVDEDVKALWNIVTTS